MSERWTGFNPEIPKDSDGSSGCGSERFWKKLVDKIWLPTGVIIGGVLGTIAFAPYSQPFSGLLAGASVGGILAWRAKEVLKEI